jgi:hypothetical protein
MSYNIIEGSTLRFYTSTPFTSFAGTVVTPDVVTFTYKADRQPSVTFTWTNPSGDPTGNIVNTGTGTFQVDVPTLNLPGTWAWRWSGQPGASGLDTTHTSVVTQGTVQVADSVIS